MDMVTRTGLDGEVAVFLTWASYIPSLCHRRYCIPVGRHPTNPMTAPRPRPRRTAPRGLAALAGT